MQYLSFPDGHKMPIVGLGTWQSTDEAVETAVETALEAGYRHIDTACHYGNEAAIGRVLKKWLDEGKVKREELFIVTKLPMIGNREDLVEHFMKLSLKSLQLDYVDLYLIHMPVGLKYKGDANIYPQTEDGKFDVDMSTDHLAIWKGMESLVTKGLAKSIGVSNFSIEQVERIVKNAEIQPANLQVELHAFFRQKPLLEICRKHGITVVAYGPLGSTGRKEAFKGKMNMDVIPSLMENPKVQELAAKHNKTPAQVLLRHLIQLEIAVIPKSVTKHRIIENFQVFDFELDASDMEEMDKLDQGAAGRSFIFSELIPGYSDHPEATF